MQAQSDEGEKGKHEKAVGGFALIRLLNHEEYGKRIVDQKPHGKPERRAQNIDVARALGGKNG